MWGEKTVIGDVTQAAYLGPWLWKVTVEKAGSFDVDKVAAASPGIEFKSAPEGYVKHPREPPPVVQDAHRPGQARRPVRAGLRDRRSDRAESVPEGLPVSARPSTRFSATRSLARIVSPRPTPPRRESCSRRGTSRRRRTSMFGDYSIGDLGSIFVMQGFAGLILFSVYVLMALGPGDHLRPDGRHQHGAWRVHDPRRLRHLDDLELLPDLPAGPVRRLFLPRDDRWPSSRPARSACWSNGR